MEFRTVIIASIAMIVIAGGFLYMLLRGSEGRRMQSPIEWVGASLAVLLIVVSVVLMGLGYTVDQGRTFVTIDDGGSVQRQAIGQPAPNFDFTLLDGDRPTDLAAYRGKVVLLNFWATWCPPCIDEMPGLNRLHSEYGDDGLVVLTLSDETRAEIDVFDTSQVALDTESGLITDAASLPMPFLKIMDGRPETYVIDRDGTIREFVLGAKDYAYFERLVTPYL